RDHIHEVQLSLANLTKAIESGAAPEALVKRMMELEKEQKGLQSQLKKEEANLLTLDKAQVIFWLNKFKNGDIDDPEFCRMLIDLFVNSVTVWDEEDNYLKITIAYNLTSLPTKTYRLGKDGRLSDFTVNAPPLSANPIIQGSLLLHTFRHPQMEYYARQDRQHLDRYSTEQKPV
ncbi:MAG: hypothetical protein NC548_56195, partial [Lachnospiraceae bacterium]|nr:hypothetical protein [Lachnospiraceae bacterium]